MGRTGAYIVIDAMLRQMQSIGKLDIEGYLGYIRHQRNYLIQTLGTVLNKIMARVI